MSVKRKLNGKSLGEKCQALEDSEIDLSNEKTAKKYGVPKNSILDFLSLFRNFIISNYFTGPMEVRESGYRLYQSLRRF